MLLRARAGPRSLIVLVLGRAVVQWSLRGCSNRRWRLIISITGSNEELVSMTEVSALLWGEGE